MFIDECNIEVIAGSGGHGCVSFRREKFVPRGGPDGGDGGDGGGVFLRANPHRRTLGHMRHTPKFRAAAGQAGMGKQMYGARGKSIWVEVPVGTIVHDCDTGELIADAVEPGRDHLLVRGGRGGKGNVHFKRPDRRTPRFAERGTDGERRRLKLTLKLLADVGLIGLPNAGKSTLLARLSNARPKIADYPFTTLAPNLGIVPIGTYDALVFADLPGLIGGASEGKGLGQRFLRHIERTRFLLILIDALDPKPEETHALLLRELENWSAELGRRRSLICYTKAELLTPEQEDALPCLGGERPLRISAHTGMGLTELCRILAERIPAGEMPSPAAERTDREDSTRWVDHRGEAPWPTRWVIPQRAGALAAPGMDQEENA